MLLQPSNILKGFTAALLEKDFLCETINTAYLTTELRDCLEKVHPKVASLFSVVARKPSTCSCQSTPGTLTPMSGASYSGNKKPCEIHPQMNNDPQSLNVGMNSQDYELLREFFDDEELKLLDLSRLGALEAKDLSHVCIVYAGRWPWSAVLPADIVQHYNSVLHFCFRLQQPLHVLHALNFKDMRTYEVVASAPADTSPDDGPLRSRLLRLQLLRHWLLHFCRALHDHFTTVVILPFKHALHQLLSSRPPLQHFLTEHARLVTELRQRCLLSGGDSESPAQLALKQVVWVVQEVGGAWRRGGCGQAELCRLEASYAACHRFLLRLITALAKTADQYQHRE
ncbi:uncharacterized protein LOC108672329 isoform X2 [Hyalella azteca]|uniref:Uncharacterized protein LOC108672329 isoform X2 n=1 Tax=Hyalella azteca TaxID=294128 RepID=A0A979FTY1_HYAAZ|nr:uncharacterized protein LOC108672329 isoform X2 [Hyalella azteca]